MNVVPRDIVDRIEFYELRLAGWASQADQIGTSAERVADLSTKTAATRAAYDAQRRAQDVARSATITLRQALAQMATAGAAIIEQVRAQARLGGEGVYALASISPPAASSPLPAPGKPTDLAVMFADTGTLSLKWKCRNPAGSRGTMYQLWRRIGAGGDFAYIGGTGNKSFTDNTLPAGSAQVMYQIQAVRSTAAGPAAQFNVNFGVSGGGAMMARVVESAPTKIAA